MSRIRTEGDKLGSFLMATEIRIVWDGDVPGLSEHRLSLGAFGGPLESLLAALRRIATQMVSTAVEGEYPQTGRFTTVAKQLDIQVERLIEGSAGVAAVVVFNQQQSQPPLPLFEDLPIRAAVELLDAIEEESHGRPRNSAVRKYLRALPGQLRRQEYLVYDGGKERKKVEIKDLNLSEIPPDLPTLQQFEGDVIGVGFEPGRSEVRIKAEASTAISANPQEVDAALHLRGEKVRALAVRVGNRSRLINIKRASDPKFTFTNEAVEEHVFRRWDNLLRRLAK
jgi:hypothetical protein